MMYKRNKMFQDNTAKVLSHPLPIYIGRQIKIPPALKKDKKIEEKKIRKVQKKYDTFPIHIVLIFACFFTCFPVLYALIKASQENSQVIRATLLPGKEFFSNIKILFTEYSLGRYILNSFIVAFLVTSGKICLSLMAANALVFYDFKGRNFVFAFILVTLMLPTEILILGLFDVVSLQPAKDFTSFAKWFFNPVDFLFSPTKYGLGIGDSLAGIVLPFIASATGVLLFFQHFNSIPKSIGDSVRIDGANSLDFLFHILIPMSKNSIGALAVIEFIFVWGQYLWPRIIIRHNANQMIQVGLNALTSAGDSIQWNLVMTGSIISMVPPLLVFGLLYKSFMNGYALSSNK